MSELRGKGWRVLGFFLWMQGAGVVLDGRAHGIGAMLLAGGAALFALGVAQALRMPPRSVR